MIDAQEIIEKTLYERLRLKFVALGYTPDITTFADTPTGYSLYKAALTAIDTAKGFAVELYGAGSIASKGQIRTPRIVLDFNTYVDGDFGISPGPQLTYEEDEDEFTSTVYDISTYKGVLNVILITETITQERLLQKVLLQTLPSKAFIEYYDRDGNFLILQENALKLSTPKDHISEWVYTYVIPDIHFEVSTVIDTHPPIREITINQQLASELGISHFSFDL